MSADSPRRTARGVPATVPPQVVCDRSIIDSVAGFINDVTLAHQPQCDPKDTITWARFETAADISDPRFGDDWELEGNVAPPLLLILGYGQGVQVWAIPANGEAVEVLSWRHGIVSALRVLPTPSYAENGRADEPIDAYADKRPLMAICDGTTPAGSNPQFCAVNFVSLKTGAQVKTIKFKNPVLDILANRSSIVITFHERIAVFDARSLEDRLSVTTCFPSPGINPNPVALGSRWMAYSENKLLHSKRSGGGCDGDGVSSYTATVLNAAKSFGKGLRELGEQVAAGLTGTTGSGMSSKSSSFDSATGDVRQPGVVTILDIKHPMKDVSPTSGTPVSINGSDPIVAHFIAHSESVVAMEFDNSGMMLLTADRRGHDFHLFRIQPHPVGSSLAAVHHLYVLHRGDTSAKVQNITFSLDSRWVAVSTLRGTTHVFPVTPYGGTAGVRTHTSLHVVNKLSRFHRSAGLTADGRSSSPISHSDSTNFCQMLMPYHNPTLPPFPRPTVVLALAQLRQPSALGSPPGSAAPSSYSKATNTRQRLSSLSDDNGKPLSVCAVFAKSRSWLLDPPNAAREAPHKIQRKAVDSLFVMAGHGALIQYDLDTKLATNVAKEKICDDTPIELEVEAKAQWNLGRKDGSLEIQPPLTSDNWLVKDRNSCMLIDSTRQFDESDDRCDSWLSQVEIITHAGPHRRLWMGPQFVFKTYNTPSGSNLSHIDVEAVEIGVSPGPSTTCRPERSSPLNMPLNATGRSTVPVLIESGSYSSIEQSPKLMDRFRHEHMNSDFSVAHGDSRLKEDLADAMRESPSVSHKDTGGHPQRRRPSAAGSSRATASSSPSSSPKSRSGGSGGVSSTSSSSSSAATLVGGDGSVATGYNSQYESLESLVQQQQHMKTVSIEKVVNPLGTVTTITGSCDSGLDTDDVLRGVSDQDYVIHENCDESLFRPVVAIFCDETSRLDVEPEDEEYTKPPEAIGNKLIVPVIEKSVDLELTKKESMKNRGRRQMQQQHIHLVKEVKEESDDDVVKFNLAEVSRKQKSSKKKQARDEPDKSSVIVEPSKVSRTVEREEKLPTKKSLGKDGKSIVEEDLQATIKLQQTTLSVEEATRKKPTKEGLNVDTEALSDVEPVPKRTSDKILKQAKTFESEPTSKSAKTRKSADKEASAMETSFDVNSKQSKPLDSERKATKNRKSVERDALSDEECTKVSDKRSKNIEIEPKPKSSKNRKSVEKESLSDEECAAKPSSDKSGKLLKLSDNNSKAKPCKTRKSAEREVLSTEVMEKTLDKSEKPLEIELKPKSSKISKSIEREVLSEELSSLEKPLDKSDNALEIESRQKSSKIRGNIEELALSEELSDLEIPSNNARKSSIVDLTLYQEEKTAKKTTMGRKHEDRDSASMNEKLKTKASVREDTKSLIMAKAKEDDQKDPKPMQIDDTEEEKPIEFKRMTAVPSIVPGSSLKTSNKVAKNDKTAIKMETKPKSIERKSKLETGSSVESTESVISVKGVTDKKGKSSKAKTQATDKEEECPTDQVAAKDLSEIKTQKKKTKAESKKKTSETSLAVEVSNVSVLADSLLDLLPEFSDEQTTSLSVDVDKLKKTTDDDETVIDLDLDQQSKSVAVKSTPAGKISESTKSEIGVKKEACPVDKATVSETDMKIIAKKSKPEKVATPPEEPPVVCKMSNTKDTVITVEEKSPDESESSDSSKNLIEISPTQSETKTKSKKKSKAEKIEEAVKSDKPLSQSKRTQLIEIISPDLPPPSDDVTHVEKKGKKDKTSKLLKMSAKPDDSGKLEQDIPNEMTGSKITIEPIEVDTFLSDLMDSQKVTKSKSTPTESLASQESPKKGVVSPLKFVDTYADSFATPEIPAKKEKGKKKSTPVKVSDKSENGHIKPSCDGIQFFDKFLPETSTAVTAPWKPVSSAEDKPISADMDYPTLGKPMRTKKSQSPPIEKKEKTLTFSIDMQDEKKSKDKKVLQILDDLPILQPLEDIPIGFLPPLPPLEPLEAADENISLINFESPLQETSKPIEAEKSSPQFPKGFPADNIIFALCGSLHYENENSGKPVDSPLTLSFSDSTAHTTAEYKSLTENDDQYLSLEQSSQENAPSTSSSTCEDVTEAAYSSGGGDKITVVSEKIKNKQRRKKTLITAAPDDDEELRPLISKTDNSLTCSITTATRKDKATSDDKVTAIMKKETLPTLDNNQVNSDSSSSDQATTSEDPDDQICLNVQNTGGGHDNDTAAVTVKSTDKSAEDEADLSSSVTPPQQPSSLSASQIQQQQPNSSKKKLKRRKR